MEKDIKIGLHNRFDFIRRDAETGEILGEYKAENIILNGFWSKFLSTTSADCLKYIHFGIGTATPVATDVKLTSWLGYKLSVAVSTDSSNYNVDGTNAIKKTIRLEDTEFNGNFISEIGFSAGTSGTTGLLTKALVKDMNGNVVSIEKKSGEVLDIFGTFYVDCGTDFDSSNIHITNHDIFKFASSWGNVATYFLQGKPKRDFVGSEENKYTPANTTPTYDVANKKVIYPITNIVAANGNIGGFRGLEVGPVQVKIPCTGLSQPVLTKEVVGTGDGIKKDFQTKFGYLLNNGTAKVFVNDVEQTGGVTIDFDQMPARTYIYPDLIILSADVYPTATTLSGTVIYENPFYQKCQITSASMRRAFLYGSNDLENWTQLANVSTSVTVTRTFSGEYRYYKAVFGEPAYAGTTGFVNVLTADAGALLTNIHFDTPPAAGATIAVTYQPDVIAKDAQHVLNNVKVNLIFAEYTP